MGPEQPVDKLTIEREGEGQRVQSSLQQVRKDSRIRV